MQYANKHYRGSGHSVFASFEPGEDQQRCYAYGVLVWLGVALCRMVVYGSLSDLT